MHLVVQITNNTSEPFPVSFDDTFIPELVNSDGQTSQGVFVVNEQESINQKQPQQLSWIFQLKCLFSKLANFNRQEDTKIINSWLVQPGKDTCVWLDGRLFWQNNLLILELPNKDFSFDFEYFRTRTYYSFHALQPGNYQLRFIYINKINSNYNNKSVEIGVTNQSPTNSIDPATPRVNFH
ncbi:hypothetical protein F7734_54520 [Scytonema sp. UIC 10036]|uniref:hypothetical protein n=1 Tax=Scytonema sp. UIC 10036 TaxID=2304196 RepID=UPI0012DA2ED7|nr:hypothetical protein [Scytonema sp. UIC 10036]MUH00814.1 hypothetical protein [Scytonema sp. UIC 10036]